MNEYIINNPEIWRAALPFPKPGDNKYSRGHLLVLGGAPHQTGASRMAALAGQRAGAGAVTVIAEKESVPIYAAHLTSIMIQPFSGVKEFAKLMAIKHVSGMVIGPGSGVDEMTREVTMLALESALPFILDADGLTAFAEKYPGRSGELFAAIKAQNRQVVMTPHEGEFAKLFPEIKGDRREKALAAANSSGAVILLKGSETVIAAPGGQVIINKNAPAILATAGSGDVLAGIIGGLICQGMKPFKAAAAGAWIHAEAANIFGAGLIAEDLPGLIPGVLQKLEN